MDNTSMSVRNVVTGKKRTIRLSNKMQRNVIGWLIMLPTVVLMIILTYRPVIIGIGMSFFETKGFEIGKFIGLENYKLILQDGLFVKALINMGKYELWSILCMITPFVMAIAVNEVFRGKAFFRFALYFPSIVPGIVASLLWGIILNPGEGGLLNMLIGLFGINPVAWLQNSNTVIPAIILRCSWTFGGTMIYYLAALQSVSPDLYEAAELDGATFIGKFRHVTLPHLLPLVGMMFILNIIATFQMFDIPLAMTAGGPNYASLPLGMLTYNYAFSYLQVGRSAATSVIMSIILIAFSVIYFKAQIGNKK